MMNPNVGNILVTHALKKKGEKKHFLIHLETNVIYQVSQENCHRNLGETVQQAAVYSALVHKHANTSVVKSCLPLCCGKSYGIHRSASDHPLNVFSFPHFPCDAFVYVQ